MVSESFLLLNRVCFVLTLISQSFLNRENECGKSKINPIEYVGSYDPLKFSPNGER